MAENKIHPSCDSDGCVTSPETLACQVQCDQTARAGRVDGDTWPLQVKEIRDPICGHRAGLSGICALVHGDTLWVSQEKICVVGAEGSNKTRGLATHDLGHGNARCES